MTGLRYFSTFSGIGGFELGIQAVMPDAECVGFSEIDKYAASVYQHHFTEAKNYGDITNINPADIPAFDLFVGGFPCQAFSVAGKRLGFDDTRGTLFFEVARILKAKRPRHLVLENVKGLLSHDGGKTFATILGVLTDLGYFVEWQVLNSKDHGVPQNRQRVYIVGHLGSAPRRKVFPFFGEGEGTRNSTRRGELVDLTRRSAHNYTARSDGRTGTLDANYYKGLANQERPGVLVREATSIGYAEATVGDTINISVPTSKTRRGRVQKGVAGTLQTSENQVTLMPDARIRRLTPVECERLQGFPDNWTSQSTNGPVSDTQRYKMCGNAVTTKVVATVMERLFNDGH